MWTWTRRLFGLALFCGGAYAAYTAWQRRTEPVPEGPPEWPPLDDTPDTSVGAAGVRAAPPSQRAPEAGVPADEHRQRWVEPVDGACPDGYPIKAKDNSGIYHVPGGRFYDRTVPDRCYTDEASAESDGYRRAKA